MKEWPLIGLTLATQLACGLAVAVTVADTAAMRPLALAIFPLVAIGLLFSLAHLGRPAKSWRALVNLRRSRLSLEVLLTAVFALLALADSAFWWVGKSDGRAILGAATSLAGIAAVIAGALIYMIPAQPAWNSGWVLTSFLGTVLLFGGLAPALLISSRVFLVAIIGGSLLMLMAALWMLAKSTCNLFWAACHIVLVAVLPMVIAPSSLTLAAVLIGAAIGRALMYTLASPGGF